MNARILVVDDDTAISEMIGIVLKAEGFEPQFAGDGAEAIELFKVMKPDLVLLDLMLPGIDGIQVCAAIRAESGVPIIMLTAKDAELDRVHGQGWALVDQELEEGLRSIAAPIHDAGGRTIAAVNVSAHASRVSAEEIKRTLLPPLLAAAQRIEADLSRAYNHR